MFNQLFELHAELLKALANPHRLEILHLLRDQELCVSDIHEMLDLPQAKVSQNLMLLRELKVVSSRKEGKQIFYKISDPRFIEASDLIREILSDLYQETELGNGFSVPIKELVPLVHDPVCEMRVSPKTAGFSHRHQGENYYFCASGCLKKFAESPESYV